MKKLRVFLVDDHSVLREGLRMLIEAQPDIEVIGQADSGRSALQIIPECHPDVVVMDVTMSDLGGAEATERLKERCPDLRVLALTRHSDYGYMRRMFEAGANGYVLKRAAAEELIVAIRTVAAGKTYIDSTFANHMMTSLVGRKTTPATTAPAIALGDREKTVLRLIAWGHSNKEIATELGISVKTVEYYKARAMEKLSLESRTDIVRYAIGQGWMKES